MDFFDTQASDADPKSDGFKDCFDENASLSDNDALDADFFQSSTHSTRSNFDSISGFSACGLFSSKEQSSRSKGAFARVQRNQSRKRHTKNKEKQLTREKLPSSGMSPESGQKPKDQVKRKKTSMRSNAKRKRLRSKHKPVGGSPRKGEKGQFGPGKAETRQGFGKLAIRGKFDKLPSKKESFSKFSFFGQFEKKPEKYSKRNRVKKKPRRGSKQPKSRSNSNKRTATSNQIQIEPSRPDPAKKKSPKLRLNDAKNPANFLSKVSFDLCKKPKPKSHRSFKSKMLSSTKIAKSRAKRRDPKLPSRAVLRPKTRLLAKPTGESKRRPKLKSKVMNKRRGSPRRRRESPYKMSLPDGKLRVKAVAAKPKNKGRRCRANAKRRPRRRMF